MLILMKRVMECRSYWLVFIFLLHCRESLMDYDCMELSVPITPQLIPPVGCCSSRNLFARVDGCHYHFTIRCLQGHPVEKVFPPRHATPFRLIPIITVLIRDPPRRPSALDSCGRRDIRISQNLLRFLVSGNGS